PALPGHLISAWRRRPDDSAQQRAALGAGAWRDLCSLPGKAPDRAGARSGARVHAGDVAPFARLVRAILVTRSCTSYFSIIGFSLYKRKTNNKTKKSTIAKNYIIPPADVMSIIKQIQTSICQQSSHCSTEG